MEEGRDTGPVERHASSTRSNSAAHKGLTTFPQESGPAMVAKRFSTFAQRKSSLIAAENSSEGSGNFLKSRQPYEGLRRNCLANER